MKLDYYRAILFGGIIVAVLLSMFYVFTTNDDTKPLQESQASGTFTTVDQYKGCDVVQYWNHYESRSHYFLDCRPDSVRNKDD